MTLHEILIQALGVGTSFYDRPLSKAQFEEALRRLEPTEQAIREAIESAREDGPAREPWNELEREGFQQGITVTLVALGLDEPIAKVQSGEDQP